MKIDVGTKRAILIIALICVSAIMQGCATMRSVGAWMNDNEIYVKVAIAHTLEERPEWKGPAVRLSNGALAVVTAGDVTTVAGLKEYAMSQIKFQGMLPEDKLLLEDLIGKVQKGIMTDMTNAGVAMSSEEKIKAVEFFTWLREVAQRPSLSQ